MIIERMDIQNSVLYANGNANANSGRIRVQKLFKGDCYGKRVHQEDDYWQQDKE